MKNIKIVDSNENSRILVIEDNATLFDICRSGFLFDLFETDVDDICDSIEQMNGMYIPNDTAFRSRTFECVPAEDTELVFSLEFAQCDVNDEEEESEESAESTSVSEPQHLPGVVLVLTSGGLRSTAVNIISGETTISQAIHDPAVLQRSGMTEAQLSNQNVLLNNESIAANFVDTKTLKDGDTITLSPRFAHDKGL